MDRRTFLAGVTAMAVPVAGCAGGGGGTTTTDMGETATPTATATPTGESVAQQKFPDYNWKLLEDADPEFTTKVTLRNQSFNPVIAKVPTGTVRFVNEDSYEHTVTIPALGVKKTLSGGASAEVAVDSTGRYDYVCELHPPSMLGRLLVVAETPTGDETPTATPTSGGETTTTGGGGGYY